MLNYTNLANYIQVCNCNSKQKIAVILQKFLNFWAKNVVKVGSFLYLPYTYLGAQILPIHQVHAYASNPENIVRRYEF